VLILHQFEQFAFAGQGISHTQAGKLDLLRVMNNIDIVEIPIIQRTVIGIF